MPGFMTTCSLFISLAAGRANLFWSNTIWYVLLGITTLFELAVILWGSKKRKFILAFYFTITGMAFCFEMVVLSVFKSYHYMPMLIPQSQSEDDIAGNLFSQFSVSATAVLIALFRLRYYWYLLFAAAYGLIEELFLDLGIYKHNWYQTWMTVVLLPVLFWLTKKAYALCLKSMKPIWRYVFIFFGLVTLHIHTTTWVLELAGIRAYSEQVLSDKDRSIVMLSILYTLVLGGAIMLLYFSRLGWSWKLPLIFVLYIGVKIAEHFRLILFKDGWFLVASSISIWAMYLYTYLLDRMYDQLDEPDNR